MGRKQSIAYIFWIRNFGFTSKRKYGFLHSTWEVIIARRTGTTHSILDYVVYRLFFVLALVAVTVWKLSQVNPFPFLVYFETWVLFAHVIYAFLFLRQVLVHNHHRKALGRRQRMPDQLVITDEIEKDGHKYYISKKISILPRENLSPYEKFVWVVFNISGTMSLVCYVATDLLNLLVRKNRLGKDEPSNYDHFLLVKLGAIVTVLDIGVNTVPARFGHFIYSMLFCVVYFLVAYLYDTTRGKKAIHLYKDDVWSFRSGKAMKYTNLKILGLVLPCHIAIVLLAELRDFVVSLLDRSRTAVNQQKVRTQKRLARRKLMVPIYGPDGQIDRIILEHGAGGVQEDWIYWRDEGGATDWDGSSDDAKPGKLEDIKVEGGKGPQKKGPVVKKKNLPNFVKIIKPEDMKEASQPYGPPPDLTATMDVKPVNKKVVRKIEDVRLPSPPKGFPKGTLQKNVIKDTGKKVTPVPEEKGNVPKIKAIQTQTTPQRQVPPKLPEEPPPKLPELPVKAVQQPKPLPKQEQLPKGEQSPKAEQSPKPEQSAKPEQPPKPPPKLESPPKELSPKVEQLPKIVPTHNLPKPVPKNVPEPLKLKEPNEKDQKKDTPKIEDVDLSPPPPKKVLKKQKKKVSLPVPLPSTEEEVPVEVLKPVSPPPTTKPLPEEPPSKLTKLPPKATEPPKSTEPRPHPSTHPNKEISTPKVSPEAPSKTTPPTKTTPPPHKHVEPPPEPIHHYQLPITRKSHMPKDAEEPHPSKTPVEPSLHYMTPITRKSHSKKTSANSQKSTATPKKHSDHGHGQIPFIVSPPPKKVSVSKRKSRERPRSPPTPPKKADPTPTPSKDEEPRRRSVDIDKSETPSASGGDAGRKLDKKKGRNARRASRQRQRQRRISGGSTSTDVSVRSHEGVKGKRVSRPLKKGNVKKHSK